MKLPKKWNITYLGASNFKALTRDLDDGRYWLITQENECDIPKNALATCWLELLDPEHDQNIAWKCSCLHEALTIADSAV